MRVLPLFFHNALIATFLLMANIATASERELTLQLRGVIHERCAVSIPADTETLDFSQQVDHTVQLNINCNSPMKLLLLSDNGALLARDNTPGSTRLEPYQATLAIEDLQLSKTMTSAELKRGVSLSTSKIPFKTSGKLEIHLERPLVYAGEYQDVLHVNIFPAPGFGGF